MEDTQFEQEWIGFDIVKRIAKEYQGIEEVTDPDDGEDVIDGSEEAGQGGIEEVIDSSKDNFIEGGKVSFRNGITVAILSVWVVWNLVGLIQYVVTGNTVLLLTSPAVLSVPLHKVLGYHFHD